jgi:phosphoglycolate phosphatase
MNDIETIFIDFNGTILDDVDLCLGLLNALLESQNKRTLNLDEYKHVFKFPIIDYYRDAGLDFKIESYESMAHKFIDKYSLFSLDCKLYDGVIETLKYIKKKKIRCVLLSACEIHNLMTQLNYYKITDYFDDVLGTSDIYAASKETIALNYIKFKNIDINKASMVGDTLHDYEVSKAINVKPYLVSCGHQAEDVISNSDAVIIKSLKDIINYL